VFAELTEAIEKEPDVGQEEHERQDREQAPETIGHQPSVDAVIGERDDG